MNKVIETEAKEINTDKLNLFEKFVIKHEEWRTPIVESHGNMFTKYDVFSGYMTIFGIITWIFFSLGIAINFFLLSLVLYFFNRIIFKKKNKKK